MAGKQSAKVKFILQREDGKIGSITRDSDLGLQVGMIDPLSQCRIIDMEEAWDRRGKSKRKSESEGGMMKAVIETQEDLYLIRIYGSDGLLCDAYVVEKIYYSEEGRRVELSNLPSSLTKQTLIGG